VVFQLIYNPGKPERAGFRPGLTSEVQVRREDEGEDDGGAQQFTPIPAGAGPPAIFLGGSAESQALNLLVLRLLRQVTDHDHHHDRDNRNEHAEILKVDIVDDPEE